MARLVDHLVAGRAADARPPTEHELTSTRIVSVPITETSAKVRTGPPIEEPDLSLPVWAGVIPLEVLRGEPLPAPDCTRELPNYLHADEHGRMRW